MKTEQKIEKQYKKCSAILKRESEKLGFSLIDGGCEINNSKETELWVIFANPIDEAVGLIIEAKYDIFESLKMSYIVYTYDEMGDKIQKIHDYGTRNSH